MFTPGIQCPDKLGEVLVILGQLRKVGCSVGCLELCVGDTGEVNDLTVAKLKYLIFILL